MGRRPEECVEVGVCHRARQCVLVTTTFHQQLQRHARFIRSRAKSTCLGHMVENPVCLYKTVDQQRSHLCWH